MSRPDFVTEDDIKRWDEIIDNDDILSPEMMKNPIIREVCYAGQWVCDQLEVLDCPPEMITRIQFTAAQLSFGRDIWEVHQSFVEGYKRGELDFEIGDKSTLN